MTRSIAIIGTGFAGVGMAIRLEQAGIDSYTLYERSDRVGGTWRDNHYPGARCDVPSLLYSFSFERKVPWKHVYAGQEEILEYLEACVDKYDLRRHIRFGVNLVHGRFDPTLNRWALRASDGAELDADVVISGVGQLHNPRLPDIPGLESFAGTSFHSAEWRHDHDLAGRRVAIIGNGASAIQFTPSVAEAAQTLHIFQRTASWIIPAIPRNRQYASWERWAFRRVPFYAALIRLLIFLFYESRIFLFRKGHWMNGVIAWLARRNLKGGVQSESLRRKLTPDYAPGCKRILLSTNYYPALTRDNVTLVTDAIDHITNDGVVTQGGTHYPADTLILATGFEATRFLAPLELEGVEGRRLSVEWKDGAEAYLGITVAGFPNLFLLYGPNTGLGHSSIIFMLERQSCYVVQCIQHMRDNDVESLQVQRDVQTLFNKRLQEKLAATHWTGNCTSWYKLGSGRITNNWAGSVLYYWWLTRRVDLAVFEQTPAEARVEDAVASAG